MEGLSGDSRLGTKTRDKSAIDDDILTQPQLMPSFQVTFVSKLQSSSETGNIYKDET